MSEKYKNLACEFDEQKVRVFDIDTGVTISGFAVNNVGDIRQATVSGNTVCVVCEKRTLIYNARTGGYLRST